MKLSGGAVYLQKKNLVVTESVDLFILQETSFSDAGQSSNSSAPCLECESLLDFSVTSASDFHHRSMMFMLQHLGPAALDQVKAWQL
jgi:hypothetical protein